ncbi:acyltransferase domain-containing protein [Clostridium carnis]
MTLDEFCKGIKINEETKVMISKQILSKDVFEEYNKLFNTDKNKFLYKLDNEENKEEIGLIFYVMKSLDIYERFLEKGISKKIFFDTFHDITLWSNYYKNKTGKIGLAELPWFIAHTEMKLFRLGRLQFEISVLNKDRNINGKWYKKGMKILKVHIPEGKSLEEKECQESFLEAIKFFGTEYTMFFCESWLLSPNLKDILPAESNIIKFQNRFLIIDIIYTSRQAEERIFGEVLEDKTKYSEETSLRRKAKEYLKIHDDLGIGIGCILINP